MAARCSRSTSIRSVPVKLLWDNRTVINNHLARARGGKVSFTQDALEANVKAIVDALVRSKPAGAKGKYLKKVAVSSTMGAGIKVDVADVSAA